MADDTRIIPLPPFKSWLASNIPAVYDNTMTYYEELCAMISYLEKQVTPAVNANTVELAELKSYVENYFTDLNVQEEINNKLDQMAEDGTLEEIIGHYITDNYVTKDMYATSSDAGVIKVGDTLEIEDGVLNAKEDIDYIPAEFKVTRYNGAGGYTTVYYALIDSDYKPKLTLANGVINSVELGGDNALHYKSTFSVNAGRFNTTTNATTGVIIADGQILKQNDAGGTGANEILYMTSDGTLNSVTDITSADQLISLGAIWAVQGWYPFIKNGVDLTGTRDPSDYQPRSVISQDANGNYLIMVCMGRAFNEIGLNAVDCKNFATSINFTPVFMYNLDGGGSVNFIEHGQRMNGLIERENRPVANFITWTSESAKNNGVFKAANTVDHKNIQNERLGRPINIKPRITYGANVTGNLNTTVLMFGEMVLANFDIQVNTALSAYGRIAEGLPKNATSDSHFIFRKQNTGDTATAFIDNQGRLSLDSSNSMSTGKWNGTIIYSTDSGLTQGYAPE